MPPRRDSTISGTATAAPAGSFGGDSEMARQVRDHDWSATALGGIGQWPRSLRAVVQLVLESPLPMIVLWGAELVQIYNDGYREIMAAKHPAGLGMPTRECWPEVWSFNAPIYAAVLRGESRSFRRQKLTIERLGAPEEAWFDLTFMPVRDDGGAIAGILVSVAEVTTEVLAGLRQGFHADLEKQLRPLLSAEDVMAAASELLGRCLEADLVAYAEIDPGSRIATISRDWNNGGLPSIAGRHRLEDFGPTIASQLTDGQLVVVDDAATDPRAASPESRRAFARLSVRSLLDVPLVKDGRLYAVLAVLGKEPRVWTAGDAELARDVAERTWSAVERARAESALRESEALLEAIFESSPLGMGVWDPDLRFVRVNRRLAEMNGIEPEAHVGRRPTELLPGLGDLEPLMQRWREVLATGQPLFGVEVTGSTPAQPAVRRHWTEHFFPIRVGARIIGLGGVVEDTTERRQAEDQRALLVNELNHRIKNTLAVVQAIARRTLSGAGVAVEIRETLEGRLAALATAHGRLTSAQWESVSLLDLVHDVAALCGLEGDRLEIDGGHVVLDPREAVTMALAMHELCTNAIKYGAMSNDHGTIRVSWRIRPAEVPVLELEWRERDGPEVTPPQQRGFGTRMIEQALAKDLRGEVNLDFRPEGLLCTIVAPRGR